MDYLKKLWEQVRQLFGNMSTSQRLSLAMLTVTMMLSIGLLIFMTTGTSWAKLYDSDLALEDLDTTVRKLQELGIRHEMRDGMLYVPREELYTTRMRLAGEGVLPEGKDPFGFLEEPNFWDTHQKVEMRHNQALQKNLQNMLEKAGIVKRAWITITEHDGGILVFDNEEPRKASVKVQLSGNRKLNDEEVRAIANLVSSAVPNLPVDRVSIVDTKLNFYRITDSDDLAIPTDQLRLRQMYENYYAKKVFEHLGAFIDKVHVVTDITLNVKKVEEKTKNVGGDDVTTLENTHTIKEDEEREGVGDLPVGPPNENRNLGGLTGTKSKRSVKDDEGEPIAWDEALSWIQSTPDVIEKKSISVIVDQAYIDQYVAGSNGATTKQAVIDSLQAAALAAIGSTNPQEVVIRDLPFIGKAEEVAEASAAAMWMQFAQENWYKFALLTFVVAAFLMVFFTLKRSLPDLTVAEEALTEEEEPEVLLPEVIKGMEDVKVDQMKEKIQGSISNDPNTSAALLSKWIQKG